MKNWLRASASVGISIFTLWLAMRQVQVSQVAEALGHVNGWLLLISLLFLAGVMWTKAERWCWLLDLTGRLDRGPLLLALLIGYLGNVVLPFRLGELVRVGAAGRTAHIPAPLALSTILAEKILDIGTLILFLSLLGVFVPLPTWVAHASLISGGVFLGLLFALVLVVAKTNALLDLCERIQRKVPTVLSVGPWWGWINVFVNSFQSLHSGLVVMRVIGWSLISWGLGAAINLSVLWAFGITPLLPAAILTLVITNLGMALPSAPGYIGVHQYLSILALSAFAVPASQAFAYAVVIYALTFGSFALAGGVALALTGLNLIHPERQVDVILPE